MCYLASNIRFNFLDKFNFWVTERSIILIYGILIRLQGDKMGFLFSLISILSCLERWHCSYRYMQKILVIKASLLRKHEFQILQYVLDQFHFETRVSNTTVRIWSISFRKNEIQILKNVFDQFHFGNTSNKY